MICAGLLWALLLQAPAASAASFGSPGTAGADFLRIPSSTRPAGMGGAAVASAERIEALEYNPALLSSVLGWELGAQHLSYAGGIALEQLDLGWGRAGLGTGLSVLSLSTPDIPGTDINGASVGTFKQQDIAVSGGAAWGQGGLSLGAVARVLQRSIAGFSYGGAEADLGAAWQAGAGWKLGLAVQHLGSLGALSEAADPAPLVFRGGLGWAHESVDGLSFQGELDAVQPRDSSPQARLGVEAGWSFFFARAGAQVSQAFDGRQPFTVGAGIRVSSWQLDYSFADLQGLGAAHRIGLNWRLDGAYRGRKGLQAPEGLVVKRDGQDLKLSWQGTEHAQGYAFYLRKGADVELKRLGSTSKGQTHLRLKHAAALPLLGVAVAPLGEDGQEGPLSQELKVAGGEEAMEVLPPKQLSLAIEGGERVLHWEPAARSGDFRYQVLVSRRSGSGYAPLGRPTFQSQRGLPEAEEWKSPHFVVVQAQRQGPAGLEVSALSKELDVLVK